MLSRPQAISLPAGAMMPDSENGGFIHFTIRGGGAAVAIIMITDYVITGVGSSIV